jgi:putative two-component system response regulator
MINPANILIVDDNAANRKLLYDIILSLGHTPWLAENGRSALKFLENKPIDLVLLDILMPEMDGYQVLKYMKSDSILCHLPVIIISASQSIENVVRCIEIGAEDYLTKPFNPVLLRARIDGCLEKKRLHDQEKLYLQQIEDYNLNLEALVIEQVLEITETQHAVIFAMAKLAEARDLETGEHLHRVAEYCKLLSEKLSLLPKYTSLINDNFIKNIYAASPLHDIGKVGIPDRILQKRGKLTTEEFAVMKTHSTIGAATLREVYQKHSNNRFVSVGIAVAESHHEKWDGTGYPYGLAGENIPLAGRIIALADVYDALTTQRYYKGAFSHTNSKAIILEGRAKHFDPDIVDAFLASEKIFIAIKERFADPENTLWYRQGTKFFLKT